MKTSYIASLFLIFFPSHPTSSILLFLLPWLKGWSSKTWCVILLNGIMDLHMSSLADFAVFYARGCQVYRGLTHNKFFCWYFDWYHTHKKDTKNKHRPIDWYTHINININTTCYMLTAAVCITLNEEFTNVKHLLWTVLQCSQKTHLYKPQ